MTAAVVEVRSKLKGLVVREEMITRSTMLAYERIGQKIGRSGSWVRAWLAGDPRYGLDCVIGENIRRLCEHIERGNEKMRAEDAQAYQSDSGMSEVTDSASLLPPNEY